MALTPEQIMLIAGGVGTGLGAILMHAKHSRNGGSQPRPSFSDAMRLELKKGMDDLRKEVVGELRYQGEQVRDDLRTALTTHLSTVERTVDRAVQQIQRRDQ